MIECPKRVRSDPRRYQRWSLCSSQNTVGEDRLILPLGHSEDLKYQEPAVNRADELVENATAEQRALSSSRQPKRATSRRNRMVWSPSSSQRAARCESTAEELEYIASGRFIHTRPIPQ